MRKIPLQVVVPSWFRQQYSKGSKNNRTGNQGTRSCGFQFCEDGDYFDVDTLFHSAFGGNQISLLNYDSNHSESDFASDRLALRLSASGPLKLEDVKHAWIPGHVHCSGIQIVTRGSSKPELHSVKSTLLPWGCQKFAGLPRPVGRQVARMKLLTISSHFDLAQPTF
ncbi:hypothetical protein OIU78_002446 [Salix suchowensis]|nr:hypothetical protein OIU78_002446 [Salix suchowensis]